MLDLKASYEPIQETPQLRPVRTNDYSRKAAGRSDSFDRIFNKTRLRSQDQQSVKTKSDGTAEPGQLVDISARPSKLEKNEKIVAASPNDADKPNGVDQLESEQSAQLSSGKSSQETTEPEQSAANAENNPELLTNMSQAVLAIVERPVQSSSVSLEASISSDASKDSTDNQMQVPMDEAKSLTAVPTQQKLDNLINVSAVEFSGEASLKTATESEAISQAAIEVQPTDTKPVAIPMPIQQLESQAEPMQLKQNESNLALIEQADISDLSKNQTNTAAIPILADGRVASNSANGDLLFVAQELEMAETVSLSGQKSDQQDLANSESSSTSGAEDAKSGQGNKTLNSEDIRFKLTEKNLLDSKMPDEQKPITDIKKILVSESQRLLAAKSVTEGTSPTETSVTNNQADTLPTATGLEKNIYMPARTVLDSQTVTAQSASANAEPEDLIEQIVKKVEILNKANNSEIKIQLKPEFMGKMIIKIAVEDGLVTAKFITESQHVKQLLEANLGSLRQNLESQGLRVDRTEVNVQLDNGGSFHGNDSGRQQMWEEYADRNSYNSFDQSKGEDYQLSHELGLDSYSETNPGSSPNILGDGKVDFMI